MEEFAVAAEQSNGVMATLVRIRAWQPGDGLVCSFSGHAKTSPCGPPVAVTVTHATRKCWRDWCKDGCSHCDRTTRRTVCRNHIPGLYAPGVVNAEARKAAQERLVVAYWDEYQRYIEEETRARREKAFEFADAEVRRIVMGEDA